MDPLQPVSRNEAYRRRPLADGSSRANLSTPPRHTKVQMGGSPASATSSLPHHDSVASDALTVNRLIAPEAQKRSSAYSAETAEEDKRNSQVSTASTNASSKGMRRKTHIGPWELGQSIGEGGVGKVRIVRHSVTGQEAAAKIISLRAAKKFRADSMINLYRDEKFKKSAEALMPFGIEREVVIMKLLEHPNVVRLYDVWENREELYLIMELVKGVELFECIDEAQYLEEDETVWIFRQIVAALLHAHRLGIFHRDLKPENVLIARVQDPKTNTYRPQVKLVDFGMAALQPKGRKLTSSCGSVYYAAPEIFERRYDGSKVDVWSLGVILYAMLTGHVPFSPEPYNDESLTNWLALIRSGRYHVHKELSDEAQDLIRRMLTPDPSRRINMIEIWEHPLLRKWSQRWEETPAESNLEVWVGQGPTIGSWNIKKKRDIDKDILRNLRVLWHSELEETLIAKLLSPELNHEKLFYNALRRHQEEQQENYVGISGSIGYSSSDHHHLKPVVDASELPPIPATAYTRSKSQFSILDESMKLSRSSLAKPPASVSSYDPYRASREAMPNSDKTFNVTVHRPAALSSTAHINKHSGTPSIKQGRGSLRVEALKREQHRVSTTSSFSSRCGKSPSPRAPSRAQSRSMSRSSVTSSSYYPSSPPASIVMRPSVVHKRGVNFSHIRRSSTVSGLATPRPSQTTPKRHSQRIVRPDDSITDMSDPRSSPPVKTPVISRKENLQDAHRPALRKSKTHSQVIDSEARKVSTELEKFCEEAFNRDSVASSKSASVTNSHVTYETPPSSVSNRGSTHSNPTGVYHDSRHVSSRPLPDPASETPNTFIARELAETRKRVAEQYARDESNPNLKYNEILAQLDSLMQQSSSRLAPPNESRRITSAPESRTSEQNRHLPSISEEAKNAENENTQAWRSRSEHERPPQGRQVPKLELPRPGAINPAKTIRLIDRSSPSPPRVAPLNVRKISHTSTHPSDNTSFVSSEVARLFPTDTPAESRHYASKAPPPVPPRDTSLPIKRAPPSISLHPISEEAAAKEASSKWSNESPPWRRGWFRRRTSSDDHSKPRSPRMWHEVHDRNMDPQLEGNPAIAADAKAQPSAPFVAVPGKRPGFLSFFNKRQGERKRQNVLTHDGRWEYVWEDDRNALTLARQDDEKKLRDERFQTRSSTAVGDGSRTRGFYQNNNVSAISNRSPERTRVDARDLGVQRNWLARFLHIKPASEVVCFSAGRGRIRRELTLLLRGWRRYGICDVTLDRDKNLLFGRLSAVNYLGIKEAAFVIELFVVLHHGTRANLSLARFTQRKGAASSFRKVVETVEKVMLGRGLVVTNVQTRREMAAILDV